MGLLLVYSVPPELHEGEAYTAFQRLATDEQIAEFKDRLLDCYYHCKKISDEQLECVRAQLECVQAYYNFFMDCQELFMSVGPVNSEMASIWVRKAWAYEIMLKGLLRPLQKSSLSLWLLFD